MSLEDEEMRCWRRHLIQHWHLKEETGGGALDFRGLDDFLDSNMLKKYIFFLETTDIIYATSRLIIVFTKLFYDDDFDDIEENIFLTSLVFYVFIM